MIMKKTTFFLFCVFILFSLCQNIKAQNTIHLDPTFDIGTGFINEGDVRSVLLQSDGKILVGGYFTEYNGQTQNRISRLNSDGSLDTTFDSGTGFNSYVIAINQQSDGKILVGGSFSSYKGQTQNRITRLNSDGSLDTSFNTGTGFNISWVHTIALQSDGKIIAGGSFTQYNGQAHNRIIRLNTDGSVDNTFVTGNGFNNEIWSIAIQPNGKILVGGKFSSYNGIVQNGIVRLNSDGSLDTSFNTGTGLNISEWNFSVGSIILQPDQKILVGGSFTQFNGQTHKSIIRLNTNGTIDNSFNSDQGFLFNSSNGIIQKLVLQPDQKIIVGGQFTSYNGLSVNRIARLDTNGTLDTTFNTGTGFNGYVSSVTLQPDGKIIAGGNFAYYNGQYRRCLVRLYENTCETPPTPQATLIPIPCSFIPEEIGPLVITYPLGDEYEYSIDGVNYQSSAVFPNVWAFGTLQITVRQGNCISEPLIINLENIEQSTIPIAEITQPECSDVPESGQVGTVAVTFPLGDEFQYSIDGENYQDSPVFNNVFPGAYQLTFRIHNSEFCVSDPLEFTIYLSFTEVPTVEIIQPTCENPFGKIEITSPLDDGGDSTTNYEYSINGIDYYTNNVFENLTPATYQVSVKAGDCISESLEVILSSPEIPEIPTVNVTQPTCDNPVGRIEIISPIDDGDDSTSNYVYSINGIDYYNETTFDNLPSGTYQITVKNGYCISEPLVVVIQSITDIIGNATISITQPTCENPFGQIEFTSPIDGGDSESIYEYSINGIDYFDYTVFDNLAVGVYYASVKNLMNACITEPIEVIINDLPEIYIDLVAVCEFENRFMLKAKAQDSNYEYLWNTGETSSEIEISNIGVYSVVVSLDNCSNEFSINIENIPCMITKGISPNGDSMNNQFDLSGFGTINKVEIYNRYGKIVYHQSNYTNQWKGQSNNGKELPTGTYYYRIVFQNNTTKTGWVYVNR